MPTSENYKQFSRKKFYYIENCEIGLIRGEKYHGIILDQVVTGLLIQFVFKSLATVSLDN